MADPVGLAASVLTLGGFLVTLLKFAAEIKNASEDLRRYHAVLEIIKKTTDLMVFFAAQSNSTKELEVIVNRRNEILIHCSRGVKLLISDVEKLTSALENYRGQKGQQSHATQRMLTRVKERVKGIFKGAPPSFIFVLNRNYINDLIQAAKNLESSLHHALSTMLLARNEFKTDETQLLINNMMDLVRSNSDQFEAWHKTFERSNPTVIYVNAEPGNQSPTQQSSKFFSVKTRTGKTTHSKTCAEGEGSTSDICSQTEQQSTSFMVGSSQSCHDGDSTEWEDFSKTVAVVLNDGTFQPSQSFSRYPSSTLLLPEAEDNDDPSSPEAQCQIRDGNTTDDAIFSQSEDFPATTDTEDDTIPPAICDSWELDIETNAEAFIDGAVTIANCVLLDNACFEFCVRTMIIHDDEPPVLILKEPCRNSVCEHISVCTQGGLLIEHQTPVYIHALLREKQASEALGSLDTSSFQKRRLKLFTTSHRDEEQKGNFTLILGQSGRLKQYAVQTSLLAEVFVDIEPEGEESDGSETVSEGSTVLDVVRQVEESGIQPEGRTLAEGYHFSSLPCMFCREDALRPRLSAGGAQALLFVQNNSFGYTCERCSERTWVSATTYGFTGVGATWALW